MNDQQLPDTETGVAVNVESPGVTIVANVDDLSAGNVCSCAAGDDNPF
ncbi:hypothetical protein [Actinomadura sp. SCN-SB]